MPAQSTASPHVRAVRRFRLAAFTDAAGCSRESTIALHSRLFAVAHQDLQRDLPLDEAQIQFIASASADELLQCVNRAYAALLHKNLMLEQENLQLQAKIRTMRCALPSSSSGSAKS